MKSFDFEGLFVFDMANNHQGNFKHGIEIVRAMGDVAKKSGVRGAVKFQFRHLDTFIHPDYKSATTPSHIPRFLSTRLGDNDYRRLTEEVRNNNLVTMATPFDEESVDLILDLGIEVIKVASCSATDRPLLERIAEVGHPVIVSTAGLSVNEIDRLVSFLGHKGVDFALMHCVALYPTPNARLNLNSIGMLRNRYPEIAIGFSTHESPDDFSIIRVAYGKGACLFERHVGLVTDEYKLNAYSSTPPQVESWIKAYLETVEACGGDYRSPATPEEAGSLQSLKRGVYANKTVAKGATIKIQDVFFAMPVGVNQLTSGEWREGIVADRDYKGKEPLRDILADHEATDDELIFQIMLQVRGMLNKSRIFIGEDSSIEISHHYGIKRFREFGCVIIDCVNREYCKKLIVQLPRQKHPYHFHKKKEETFQLLSGDLEVELEGKRHRLSPGHTFLVKPNQWHKFHTLDGAIFEEISTTHFNDDSFYEDANIASIPRKERKTEIANWEAVMVDKL